MSPFRIALFARGERLAGQPGEGAYLSFQSERLGRLSAVLQHAPVALALNAAIEFEDFSPFADLQTVLARPYGDQETFADYAKPPQTSERVFQTFFGT